MIDGIPVVDYTAEGLLGVVVIMIFAGWLMPRRTHRAIVEPLEKQLELKDATIAEQSAHITELMEFARLGKSMVRALEEGAER